MALRNRGLVLVNTPRQNAQRRPVRLLTLSTLFPNAERPRHGIFIANRLRLMCDSGRVEAEVLAAVPWFPGYYCESARVAPRESIAGFDVRHPRYFHWPKIGMRRQSDSLARALLRELRSSELARQTFDVVDAHFLYPDGVAAALVAEELRLPLVVTARGSDVNVLGDIPAVRARMLRMAQQAAALIAVSGALKDRMVELGMETGRIRVLRNGVDPALFAPVDRASARRYMGFHLSCPLIAAVGNLVPEKGIDLLMHTVARNPTWRLLLVGDGPERESLRFLAQRIAPGRVEFRDNMPQANLRYAYSAADVLALPSLREGWPNVVLESMACGVPVACAAVGGVPEIIGDGAPGIVVRERTVEAWAGALAALMEARFAPKDVRQYAASFGWEGVVDRQCALYEAVARRQQPMVVRAVSTAAAC
jgi:glycosyltransferase involved in cell wall biosynthesis